MAKNRFRRQVGGKTTKEDRITIGRVSSNGDSLANARAKGCFGYSLKDTRKRNR
jgi:hypothetical protein